MPDKDFSRRSFLGTGAALGAGLVARDALADAPKMPPKSQILSYDERM